MVEALRLEYEERAILDMIGDDAQARHDMHPAAFLGVEAISVTPPKPEPEPELPAMTEAEREAAIKRARLRDKFTPVTPGADPSDFG